MKRIFLVAVTIVSLSLFSTVVSASRIKDITVVEGGRDNQLVGYGLVVGLAGNGDSQLNFTIQSIANSLQRFGIQVDADSVKSDNVAAVMVTADIGPFLKPGARLDITVSSIGDADTIQGGVLLQTPLIGADGSVYAVAQGAVTIGGFFVGQGGSGGATVQKNHPTVGTIAGGAIVEREIESEIVSNNELNLLLLNPDFTSAVRVADAINDVYPGMAKANDSNNVNVHIPPIFEGQEANFIAAMGQLEVIPDVNARIIINERTGTIVATQNVRLSKVAVSHGSLVISIASNMETSQPNAFSDAGETATNESVQTDVQESAGSFDVVDDFPTIERLTAALNAMGVSTRDMISILQTMKSAGALQAELIIN